jgi:predicted transcriptional regulator
MSLKQLKIKDLTMEDFIKQIIKNLENNGFPDKKVSLPTEKMYEIADNKGLSLNKVLETMKEQEGIHFEIGDEKIVFAKIVVDESNFPNLNPEMMKKAQEMMSKMDPVEMQKIQDQIANMSEEEKEEMLEKAKGMGLF